MGKKAPVKNRNRIGRSVYETHCIGSRYDPEKRRTLQFTEIIRGNIQSRKRAERILQRQFGTDSLIVEELHHCKTYVSAPIDKFMEIVDERTEMEID